MATPTQTSPGVSQVVPAAVPAAQPRLYVLDGLRLLAASTVLFGHWVGAGIVLDGGKKGVQVWGEPTEEVFGPVVHAIAAYGWMGVDLFFLISGFVICMSGWGRTVRGSRQAGRAHMMPCRHSRSGSGNSARECKPSSKAAEVWWSVRGTEPVAPRGSMARSALVCRPVGSDGMARRLLSKVAGEAGGIRGERTTGRLRCTTLHPPSPHRT